MWVQSGIPRHALFSECNRRVCGRRATPLEKEGAFVLFRLVSAMASLIALLLSPDQCEARRYCKVMKCEAAEINSTE